MAPYDSACAACEARRRRNLKLIVGIACAIGVLGVGCLVLKKFNTAPRRQRTAPKAAVHAPLPQPKVKGPKSMNDFKISSFWLESKRGSDLVLAAGDIQNISANLYFHVRAQADLLDARGMKIGAVTNEVNELPPNATWRFLAIVKDARAKSVRFANLKEIQ